MNALIHVFQLTPRGRPLIVVFRPCDPLNPFPTHPKRLAESQRPSPALRSIFRLARGGFGSFNSAWLVAPAIKSPSAVEYAGPAVAAASPGKACGLPRRTCLPSIRVASSRTPASWEAPPVRTARRPAATSKPLLESRD